MARTDQCQICHQPVTHGRDMSWWAILLLFCNIWRGYTWMPGGYVHNTCADRAITRFWGRHEQEPQPTPPAS